jgi:hypothetical protein
MKTPRLLQALLLQQLCAAKCVWSSWKNAMSCDENTDGLSHHNKQRNNKNKPTVVDDNEASKSATENDNRSKASFHHQRDSYIQHLPSSVSKTEDTSLSYYLEHSIPPLYNDDNDELSAAISRGRTTTHSISKSNNTSKTNSSDNIANTNLHDNHHQRHHVEVVFSVATYSSLETAMAIAANIRLFNQNQSFVTVMHADFAKEKLAPIQAELEAERTFLNPIRFEMSKGGLRIMRAHFANFV